MKDFSRQSPQGEPSGLPCPAARNFIREKAREGVTPAKIGTETQNACTGHVGVKERGFCEWQERARDERGLPIYPGKMPNYDSEVARRRVAREFEPTGLSVGDGLGSKTRATCGQAFSLSCPPQSEPVNFGMGKPGAWETGP